MQIDYAIDEYLGAKRNLAHSTVAWYEWALTYFQRWCNEQGITDLIEITPAHVQRCAQDHPSESTNTHHGLVQVVKGFLAWCAEDDVWGIKKRTVDRINLPKAIQPDVGVFTEAQLRAILRACEKTRNRYRNTAIVYLLYDTGARASEVCYNAARSKQGEPTGLRMENVILGRGEESYIRVLGKGKKVRTVSIGQQTALAIKRYIHRERGGEQGSPYLFLAHGNKEPLSERALEQVVEHIGKLAGIEDVHPHRFRHTYGVRQALAGTSPFVIMKTMGHESLEAAKVYQRGMSAIQARQAAPSLVDQLYDHKHSPD